MIVKFEVAKLAKEKEFDKPSQNYYYENDNNDIQLEEIQYYEYLDSNSDEGLHSLDDRDDKFLCSAPTQSKLQKWLRDKQYIEINCGVETRCYTGTIEYIGYMYEIYYRDDYYTKNNFKTYEDALENALFEALKLIK